MTVVDTSDFNDLWLDSWLNQPETDALVNHLSSFLPIIGVAPWVNTRSGSDQGRDYAALCEKDGQRLPHLWIDVKKYANDPGIGKFWCAYLVSPWSKKPGWAINPESQTDWVVWYYRETGRMESFHYPTLRKALTLNMREAFKRRNNFNVLRRGHELSGGAILIRKEIIEDLAEKCKDQECGPYPISDFESIRKFGQNANWLST